MSSDQNKLDRRKVLSMGGMSALALGACSQASTNASSIVKKDLILDFKNNLWNRDAMARIHGNIDFSKEKFGWYKGKAIGIVPGRKNLDLVGFEGFSIARLLPLEGGKYRKVLREVGFYTDLKTGEILETFKNPYTDETVPVVPIANDPFNFTISEYYPQPPKYGGLNTAEPPKIPLLLNWDTRGDKVLLTSDIHLFYPSSLQPDEWPRESPGRMTQVSEMFRYIIDPEQLGDPDNTSVSFFGSWVRSTPWFPWLLMDQAPGQCLYVCDQGAGDTIDLIPERMLKAAEKIDPKFLSAPTEDYGPSLSSLENYKLTEKPAVKQQ